MINCKKWSLIYNSGSTKLWINCHFTLKERSVLVCLW